MDSVGRESETLSIDQKIAIVGIGCRFPGGIKNTNDFWEIIAQGLDCVQPHPPERLDPSYIYQGDRTPGKIYTAAAGYLSQDVNEFDRELFQISPEEAHHMDPQLRHLLEVSWEAFEDYGINMQELAKSPTGVYIGVMAKEYGLLLTLPDDNIGQYSATGNNSNMLSNRISYQFDLQGPSITFDTACSSSMYAIHHACDAIRKGECNLAIAGGVNLLLLPSTTIALCQARMLAKDGKCKSFDNRADGYSRGEGVGLVVLKSLKKALEDGDRIHAVIRGGAINNDGRTNGITTPNTDAQVSLLKRAYESAKISPQEVPYVEAHGTGTQAGDAAELTAIGSVLGIGRSEHYPPLTIGSVKANFGHTEGAAGVASVIKLCLVLQKRQIPKLVHFQIRNEKVDWENFQINLPTDSVEWPQKSKNVAGCSSFGFGGANAHLVLEAPPNNRKPSQREDDSRNDIYPTVLFLSASSINALNQKVSDWVDFLENADADTFHNALQTAAKRATHHQHRLAVICESYQHTIESLQRRGQGQKGGRSMLVEGRVQTMYNNRSHQLVFVFSGMGTQWWAMGRQLMVSEEIFSNCIEEIDKLLTGFGAEWSLRHLLTMETDKDKIHRTDIAQPAICAIQIALAAVYRHFGIHPDVVIGHSVGEVAAAYVAGYLSLSDAVRLIYVRGKCLQETTGKGKMAAILSPVQNVSEAIAKPEYEGKIDIACINSLSQTVISGEGNAVDRLIIDLKYQGIRCIPLKVNNAFHSFQQELIKQYFFKGTKFLRSPKFPLKSKLAPIHVKMISTVNGKYLNAEVLNSSTYWWNNIRQTVAFENSLVKLLEGGYNVFLEIGPHPSLASPIKDTMVSFSEQSGVSYHDKFSVINSLRRPSDTSQMPEDQINIYLSVAKLYVQGFPIQMNLIFPSERFSVATLPKYPWQRKQYNAIADAARKTYINPRDTHPLLGEQLVTNTSTHENNPNKDWISNYSRMMLPWLHHHKIQNAVVLPGAAFIETMIAAAAASSESDSVDEIHLRNVQFHKFHYSPKSEGVLFTSLIKLDERDKTEICIRTRNKNDNSWTLNATCDLDLSSEMRKSSNERYIDLDEIQSRCDTSIPCDTLYDKLAEGGVQIGDMLASVTSAHYSTTTEDALVFASLPRALEKESQLYMFHPALLDAIFQLFAGFAVIKTDKTGSRRNVEVPQAVKSFRILGKAPKDIVIHARKNEKGTQEVRISDNESGKIFAELDGVILAVVGSKQNGGSICWEKEWVAVDYEGGSKLLEISDVPEKLEYFLIPDKKGVTKKLINLLENTHNGLLNDIHVCDTSTDAETLLSPDINARARHVVFMQMIDECSSLNDITKETFIDSQVNKAIACIQSTLIQSIERTENVFFWIVTKGAVLARPSDKVINPLMSKALALVLTCMNEHPDIFVAAIDLPHDLSPVDCALCLSYFFDNPLLSENCLALRVRNDNINESNIELYALRLNTKPTADLVFTKKSQDWMINLDEIAQKSRGGFIRPWDRNKSLDHNVIGSTCSKQQIVVEAYIQQPYKSLGDTDQSKSGFLFAGQVLSVLPSSDTEETKPAFVGFCRSHIVTSVVQTSMSNIVPVPLKVRPLDALVTIASCLPLYIALNNTFQDSDHHVVLLTSGNDPLHVKLIELLSNSTGCNIQLSVLNIDRKEERYFNTDGVLSELKSSSIDTLIIHPNVTIDDKKMTPLLEKLRFFGTLVTFCSGTWKHPLILDQQIHVKTIDLEILRSCDHHLFLNGSITSLLQLFFPDNGDSYLMCPSSAKIASINDASGVQLCGESVVCTNHTIPIDVSYRFGDSMMAFEAETFASYLVVGGSKGLGFEIVRWLANQGAQVVYFTGRSSPDGDIAEEVKRLQNASYTLEFIKCDASDENQTTQMLAHIKDRSKYPLRGIFHCAALFADQRLQNARREDWCKVVLPKAYGALLLHQITQKLDIKLSQFVVFSSIVEFLGNDGQGGYCCANAFLTSLCLARRLEGLPATVIAPGAVASVGFAAREGFVQLFEARGMYGVNPAEVCKSLSWSLGTDAMFGLTGFLDKQLYVRANPLFTHFIGKDHISIYKKVFSRQLLEDLALSSQNINLIPSEVTDFFVQFVENRLGVTEGISSETYLGFYGLDSAMSWELSALIMSRYNVAVSAVELLNESLKISDLAILVCDRASGSEGNERQRENIDPFTSSGTLWLQELSQLENANTDIVCFPCTGKGASMFDHWVAIFALENVRLTVAQLPGWEGRRNEQPSHNLEYLVKELSSCFLTKFRQNRVAFVGCGIGALLAFEVALKLQSQHGFHICHMFVVGWYPPSSPYPVEMMQGKEDKSEQSGIEKMLRFLDNRDLKQVQIFRKSYSNVQASTEICRTYKRMNNTPLHCDMTVFSGNKDPILIPKLVANWRGEIHESHSFQRIQIKTDYKLLRNQKSNMKIASTIRNTLVGKPTISRSTSNLN